MRNDTSIAQAANAHVAIHTTRKDLTRISLSNSICGSPDGRCLMYSISSTTFLGRTFGMLPEDPKLASSVWNRFWKIAPPIATPRDEPNTRNHTTSVDAVAASSGGVDAWTDRAIAGSSRPMPIPETMVRNIQAAIEVSTRRWMRRPMPKVVVAQPSQIAHRYLPVLPTTIPTATAQGTHVAF